MSIITRLVLIFAAAVAVAPPATACGPARVEQAREHAVGEIVAFSNLEAVWIDGARSTVRVQYPKFSNGRTFYTWDFKVRTSPAVRRIDAELARQLASGEHTARVTVDLERVGGEWRVATWKI